MPVPGLFALVPPKRILLIDDDAAVVEAMSCLLEDCGMVVATAPDGASGVTVALHERPDAVLVDLGLLGMGGLGIARALAGPRQAHGMRVVLLTGWDEATAQQAMATGLFDDCLLKPFGAARLLASLTPPPLNPRNHSGGAFGSLQNLVTVR